MTKRRRTPGLLAGLVLIGPLLGACEPGVGPGSGPPADLILTGDVVTMHAVQPRAEALAVRDGRIVAVGRASDVLAMKGTRTRVVDLPGRAILPGSYDAGADAGPDGIDLRGTIEVGRPADLLVLSADPSTANPAERARIVVIEAFKSGRSVHRSNGRETRLSRSP